MASLFLVSLDIFDSIGRGKSNQIPRAGPLTRYSKQLYDDQDRPNIAFCDKDAGV